VVAAHPDDDVLGCGGTMARHVDAGAEVGVIYCTNGEGSREDSNQTREKERNDAAREAAQSLGIEVQAALALPDNSLDTIPFLELVKLIENEVRCYNPSTIYTHFSGDLNIDHRLVAQAVMTAARPQPGCNVKNIYSYEVPSSTGWAWVSPSTHFVPTKFIEITNFWHKKKAALEKYVDELRPYPHARSLEAIEALARWRGASMGLAMAEAFIVEREIV